MTITTTTITIVRLIEQVCSIQSSYIIIGIYDAPADRRSKRFPAFQPSYFEYVFGVLLASNNRSWVVVGGGDCRIVFTHVTTAIPAYAETDYFDAGVREFPGRRGRNAVTIARVFITRQHDIIIYYYIIVLGGPCSTPAAIICSNTSASCPALYSRTSARCW